MLLDLRRIIIHFSKLSVSNAGSINPGMLRETLKITNNMQIVLSVFAYEMMCMHDVRKIPTT